MPLGNPGADGPTRTLPYKLYTGASLSLSLLELIPGFKRLSSSASNYVTFLLSIIVCQNHFPLQVALAFFLAVYQH